MKPKFKNPFRVDRKIFLEPNYPSIENGDILPGEEYLLIQFVPGYVRDDANIYQVTSTVRSKEGVVIHSVKRTFVLTKCAMSSHGYYLYKRYENYEKESEKDIAMDIVGKEVDRILNIERIEQESTK